MSFITNAQRYDWQTWMLGIFRSFISGGSSAMVSGLTSMGIAPGTFNLTNSVGNTLKLMGVMFLFQGGYRMFEYLTLHGTPDQLQATLDAAADKSKEAANLVAKAKDIAPEAISDAKKSE